MAFPSFLVPVSHTVSKFAHIAPITQSMTRQGTHSSAMMHVVDWMPTLAYLTNTTMPANQVPRICVG